MAYTREQLEKRINDVGSGRYEFVRWYVDGEFGSNKRVVVSCVSDGFEWSTKACNLTHNGNGCPQCSGVRRWTAEERSAQINSLSHCKFIMWKSGFKNNKSIAVVECTNGHRWNVSVNNLICIGQKCPECQGVKRWSDIDRIKQINKIEGVSFVCWPDGGYINEYSRATVKCYECESTWSPIVSSILSGNGCPKCANSGYNPSKTGTLYALRSECGKYVKVGISNKPSKRHRKLERSTPFQFSLIEQISGDGDKIRNLEKHIHSKYDSAGFTGFDGATEWLICTPKLLEELRELEDVK